jgi:hypothetical protein
MGRVGQKVSGSVKKGVPSGGAVYAEGRKRKERTKASNGHERKNIILWEKVACSA